MFNRYSKSSEEILTLKKNFFDDNDVLLKQACEINQIYFKQPPRINCKNCNYLLGEGPSFVKMGIGYKICNNCEHLNGLNQDTDEFCNAVYTNNGGKNYAMNYTAEDKKAYLRRVFDIYIPKAEFLLESLNQINESPQDLSYADFGAGSGYFIHALLGSGIDSAIGFEVSDAQVAFGNMMIGKEQLNAHVLEDTITLAETIESNVVSMIGVLEHVQKPRELLNAFRCNKNVRYLYISVPTFSPTIFFEMMFPNVMQRQLSAGHTHLYTESSLNWMAKEFGMKKIAAWWFGTDMVDLYRSISVELGKQKKTSAMATTWSRMFGPLIDTMQAAIDKNHLSSEVHMLFQYES